MFAHNFGSIPGAQKLYKAKPSALLLSYTLFYTCLSIFTLECHLHPAFTVYVQRVHVIVTVAQSVTIHCCNKSTAGVHKGA
jgi:hypothetical protein